MADLTTKLFTLEEASKHNTKDDCWLVLDGKVYDVTQYLDEHPGGDDVLLNATGRDAIEDFDFVGHSKTARELLQTYCIGSMDPSSAAISKPAKTQTTKTNQQSTGTNSMYFAILAVVIACCVAAGLLYFPKS